MTPILAAFTFEGILLLLVWAFLAVMAMWMFQKTKSKANLLMMVGAGLLALSPLLAMLGSYSSFILYWMPFAGAVLITIGFYLSAKPVIDANLETLKKKLQEATKEKPTEDAPPSDAASGGGDD